MPDDTLDILIRIPADTSGADQSIRALKEVQKVNEEVRESAIKVSQADIEAATAAEKMQSSTKHATDRVKEAGEHVQFFNTHGREMHRLMHSMTEISPGLGLALRAAFHPQNLGILMALMAMQSIIEKIKEVRKEAEETAKQQASLAVGAWAAVQEGAENARKVYEEYTAQVRELIKAKDDLKQREEDELALLGIISSQRQKELKAKGASDDVIENQKRIEEMNKIDTMKRTLEASKFELDKRKAEHDATVDEKARGPIGALGSETEKWANEGKAKVEEAQKKYDAALKSAGGKTPEELRGIAGKMTPTEEAYLLGVANTLEATKSKLEETKGNYSAAFAAVNANARTQNQLNNSEQAALGLQNEAKAAVDEQQRKYDRAKFDYEARANVEAPATARGRSFMGAVNAEEASALGQGLSKDQNNAIALVVQALRQTGSTQQQITSVLTFLRDITKMHSDKIARLEAELRGIHTP